MRLAIPARWAEYDFGVFSIGILFGKICSRWPERPFLLRNLTFAVIMFTKNVM
jgi:hypothetical protein